MTSQAVQLMENLAVDIEPQQPLPGSVPGGPFPEVAGTVHDNVRGHVVTLGQP